MSLLRDAAKLASDRSLLETLLSLFVNFDGFEIIITNSEKDFAAKVLTQLSYLSQKAPGDEFMRDLFRTAKRMSISEDVKAHLTLSISFFPHKIQRLFEKHGPERAKQILESAALRATEEIVKSKEPLYIKELLVKLRFTTSKHWISPIYLAVSELWYKLLTSIESISQADVEQLHSLKDKNTFVTIHLNKMAQHVNARTISAAHEIPHVLALFTSHF